MRKFLLLLSPLLFIMCSNEVTDKDEYEAHIKVTANPPLDAGMGLNNLSNSLVVLGVDQDGDKLTLLTKVLVLRQNSLLKPLELI